MTVFFRPLLFLICIAFCTPLWAQALKGPKACRAELRQHAAEIRGAKVKRRDFLAACRKTAVGQDTPIGDKPAPEAAAPPQPAPPAAEPAPPPAPPPPPPPAAAEPTPAPAPDAAKPREPDPKPAETAAKPAEAAPAEDHTLPGWWNWTMRLAAAAAIAVAGFFAVRGLMRIRRAGG